MLSTLRIGPAWVERGKGDAYDRWRHGHMTRRTRRPRCPKVAHRWYLTARWHARRLAATRPGQVWNVYSCRWTDDYRAGETGIVHYHVGRLATDAQTARTRHSFSSAPPYAARRIHDC